MKKGPTQRHLDPKRVRARPNRRIPAARDPETPPAEDGRTRHAFLASVRGNATATPYRTKRVVFHQGDPASAIFFIVKGHVRLTVVSGQGREGVIAILGAGEFFGEGCLAGQPLYLSTAITMTPCEIIKVERGRMMRLLSERPESSQLFIGQLLARNIRFEADLVDQLFNSSEKRLARLLLLLATFGKAGKLETILPPISQDVLAAKIGTTRSRINFFMNKFRRLGFIEYNGSLRVHSALLNVIAHD